MAGYGLAPKTEFIYSPMDDKFISNKKMPACNGRFGTMAAVSPQTILWEIARYYPAASSVEAATAPSRWDVSGKFTDCPAQDGEAESRKVEVQMTKT